MKALIGARNASALLRLAIALTVVGSIDGVHRTADTSANGDICFLIDGQIYCIPDGGRATASAQAVKEAPRVGLLAARSEDIAIVTESTQPGEPAAAGHGRPV